MSDTKLLLSDSEIKALDAEYCSWGDTVHYHDEQTIFRNCEGSYMYDSKDTPYLDLQMWYSSCNLGYKNKRILNAVIDQYQTMPQISSRFVYDYKALLAEKIAKANLKRYIDIIANFDSLSAIKVALPVDDTIISYLNGALGIIPRNKLSHRYM